MKLRKRIATDRALAEVKHSANSLPSSVDSSKPLNYEDVQNVIENAQKLLEILKEEQL